MFVSAQIVCICVDCVVEMSVECGMMEESWESNV